MRFRLLSFAIASLLALPLLAQEDKGRPLDEMLEEGKAKRMLLERWDSKRWGLLLSDDERLVSFDRRRLTILGNKKFQTWIRWDNAKAVTADGITYQYSIAKETIDCTALASKTFVSYKYDAKGAVVDSWEAKEAAKVQWQDAVPQSVGEYVLDRFCKIMTPAGKRLD